MSPTTTPPPPDPRRPDTSAFLEQQAAILLDAPDNDTMVRRLLAAALRRISELEQQLAAAAPPGRPPRPQPSLRPRILTLLREQPDGLTRPQIEEALGRRGLGDTLQRMVRDALLVRTGDRYRLTHAGEEGQEQAAAVPPLASAAPASSPLPAPRKRGSRPRTRGRA